MADKNIGALPQAPQLDDDSLLVAEQQGQAMKVTGAQFKEFGRQAVIGQVQEYVDQAEDAANRAMEAVSAVTEMTVESKTLGTGQQAEVSKTMKEGKVHLTFGLPRGEQGVPGPEGQTGPRGPQGPPGAGLEILGYYGTLPELEAAVPNPKPGHAYGVGSEAPYDIYVFDGVSNAWKNNGPLTGGGGGSVLPEDVVTSAGGASFLYGAGAGEAPHVIEFNFEEEPPLTAGDITYGDATLQEAVEELFSSVSDGKQLIASAVTDKGVPTAQDATFAEMAENIGQISSGADTSDATATPGDILAPKTAYTAAGKVEGIVPTLPARTITPGTAPQTIANGQYLGGTQTIQGDTNLTSNNIRKGVSIFGVAGAMESSFQATLTVKADTGAVVTAKNGDTEVSALSTNGQVVLDLPIEGTWKVTAQRGMAQYNTVVIEVTSSYHAELTAEVHVEYMLTTTPLQKWASKLAATAVGQYALFSGGEYSKTSPNNVAVNAYDQNFTRTSAPDLSTGVCKLAAAAVGEYALFGGGAEYTFREGFPPRSYFSTRSYVTAYSSDLVKTRPTSFSQDKAYLAAAAIGDYALFGGGASGIKTTTGLNYDPPPPIEEPYSWTVKGTVDSYSKDLTHEMAQDLFAARFKLACVSNEHYVLFGGGIQAEKSVSDLVDAYDDELTHTFAGKLSEARANLSAATAGNYMLFAGGATTDGEDSKDAVATVDAYDMYLTRTSVESLSIARAYMAASTVNGFAVFSGGCIKTNSSDSYSPYGSDVVDVYDPYLTRTTSDPLSSKRYFHAAANIGNYILFGGGYSTTTVDIYRYV